MKVLIYCSNLYLEYQLISNLNRENINYKKGYANLDNLNYFKKEIEYVKPTNIIYFFDKNNNIFENNVNNTINHMTSIIKILKFCKVKNIHFTYINYKLLINSSKLSFLFKPNFLRNLLLEVCTLSTEIPKSLAISLLEKFNFASAHNFKSDCLKFGNFVFNSL